MKPNVVSEKLVAWAQIATTLILVISFVGILIASMFFPTPANQPASTTANVNSMLTVLGTLTTLGVQFFLARQRNAAGADPGTVTIQPPTTGAPANGTQITVGSQASSPPGPGSLSIRSGGSTAAI